MLCGQVESSWEFFVFDFGISVFEVCLMCSSLIQFFFHFPGQCVTSKVILMGSLLFYSSNILRWQSLHKKICTVVFFCLKKFVVTVVAVFLSFCS